MRFIRTIHLYLGCLFAPLLIFFAISGASQTFLFHRAAKDGSYTPGSSAATSLPRTPSPPNHPNMPSSRRSSSTIVSWTRRNSC